MKIILSANTAWYLFNYRLPLARTLKARGWDVVMMAPRDDYALKFEAHGLRWIPWDLGRKTIAPWSEMAAISKVTEIYRAEKPDVVHHNTIKPSIYGSIAARRAGVRGIVNSITGRGYVFIGADMQARALRGFVHSLYRRAFRPQNVRAIFENRTDLDYFVRNSLIEDRRAVLIESSGVDETIFTVRPEPAGIPVIMMAARMLWDKGVEELVQAARLIGAPEKARVVLVGDPDEGNPNAIPRSRLAGWHEEGIIEWWGFRSDMSCVLGECHIFTLPTKYTEGLPVSLLEASASGRPVVTTTMPGPQDFVVDGETGFLVPPGDATALAAAFERLIRDAELRGRMGAAGRRRVEAHYTSSIVNERTIALYQSLLAM